MTSHVSTRPRRGVPLAAALVLLLALVAAPAARAETTGTVTVTATIATEMTLTLCDTEANFGDGLTSTGATPQNTTDAIGVTDPVDVTGPSYDPTQGRFYSWTPSCQAEETNYMLRVVSTLPWRLTPCATENSGPAASPTMTLARSLRWDTLPNPQTSYGNLADSSPSFGQCPSGNGFSYVSIPGSQDMPLHLYLRVDPSDQAGTFSSQVVWTLTPQ
jgi:hypothetical protein